VRRPSPYALDSGEGGDHGLVIERVEGIERHVSPCGALRQVAQIADLLPGEARAAKRCVGQTDQLSRAGRSRVEEGEQTTMDGSRRLSRKLLIDDGPHDVVEVRPRRLHSEAAGPHSLDHAREYRVGALEVTHGSTGHAPNVARSRPRPRCASYAVCSRRARALDRTPEATRTCRGGPWRSDSRRSASRSSRFRSSPHR